MRLARLATLVASLAWTILLLPAAAPARVDAALPRWTGGIDLYRSGVFTTQKTWLWCTAADVQIMRNIVTGARDHSYAAQKAYFGYMRAHDRYAIPVSDGTDPAGWTAGLRHNVDSRYQLVVSSTFDAALRSAVTSLRRTNRPVGLFVAHGDHAWVLTGFTATADPAVTRSFTVTSVRVTGPLWGLQNSSYGYDMRPDTRLTPAQLAHFVTPWHYARIHMVWEGRYLTIQASGGTSVVAGSAATTRAATPRPTPRPSAHPTPTPTSAPSPTVAPSVAASDAVGPTPASIAPLVGGVVAGGSSEPAIGANASNATGDAIGGFVTGTIALVLFALGIVVLAALSRARSSGRSSPRKTGPGGS